MSYVFLSCNKYNDEFLLLDTDSLSTKILSKSEYECIRKSGVPIKAFGKSESVFGISAKDNQYSIHVHGYKLPIYGGSFPKTNLKDGDLYQHSIRIADYGRVGDMICIVVTCKCWCACEFEIPVVFLHVIAIPVYSFKDLFLAIYTSSAIPIKTNLEFDNCFGITLGVVNDIETDSVLRVFGVDYGTSIPDGEDLCDKLNNLNR